MFTIEDIYPIVRQRFQPGSAVVDLKHQEVFRFSLECDAKVVYEYPDAFRAATKEEEISLKGSGESSIPL